MIYENDCTLPNEYIEWIAREGLEGLPDLIRLLVNEAMRMERENYLGAKPYEHSEDRQGHANAASPRQSRRGWVRSPLKFRRFREGGFYPDVLEKGMRSERALILTMAEM